MSAVQPESKGSRMSALVDWIGPLRSCQLAAGTAFAIVLATASLTGAANDD